MRKLGAFLATGLLLASGQPAAMASEAAASADAPPFVTMDPFEVPIIDGNRADGTLHVKLVLVAADTATAVRLSEKVPEIRARSLAAAIEFASLYASPLAPVDASRLSVDMTSALRAADAGIARVLLVEVSARRA